MSADGRDAAVPRRWSDAEIESVFGTSADAVVRGLFQFVRQESHEGQIQSGEPVTVPTFNFYVRARRRNGTVGSNVAFEYRDGWGFVRVFLNWQKYEVSEKALSDFRSDLKAAFGSAVDVSMREPRVPLTALAGGRDAFKSAVMKFRDAMERVS
jgi:hypothetical protein